MDAVGVAGARRFRPRVRTTVRLARVRTRRRAADAASQQLRRPAAALDLHPAPRVGVALLAGEPDPHARTPALPARRRPADGRVRSARCEPAADPARDGTRGGGARGACASPLGRSLRRRGLPVRGGPRGPPVAPVASPRGRGCDGRVEEPVPGAVCAPARVPARAARGPGAALELARSAAAGRARAAPRLACGPAVGCFAARPPAHVRVRLGRGGSLGDRERPLSRGPAEPRRRRAAGHVGGRPGDRRLSSGVARGLGAGMGDRRGEPARLPGPELRPVAAAFGGGARRGDRARGVTRTCSSSSRPLACSACCFWSGSRPGPGTTPR